MAQLLGTVSMKCKGLAKQMSLQLVCVIVVGACEWRCQGNMLLLD